MGEDPIPCISVVPGWVVLGCIRKQPEGAMKSEPVSCVLLIASASVPDPSFLPWLFLEMACELKDDVSPFLPKSLLIIVFIAVTERAN